MGEWVFFICKTCREAKWLEIHELIEILADHSGHEISVLPSVTLEDEEEFEEWFKKFMGWNKEEGEEDE